MNEEEEYADPEGRPTFHTQCSKGHPLWLVAEGYGYCRSDGGWFSAWRFTYPGSGTLWRPFKLWDDTLAWVYRVDTKDLTEILRVIKNDMLYSPPSAPAPAPSYAEWLATVS